MFCQQLIFNVIDFYCKKDYNLYEKSDLGYIISILIEVYNMKKIVAMVLSTVILILLCACTSNNTESKMFSQEITIIKNEKPSMSKTTMSNAIVNEVIDILGLIDKSPVQEGDAIDDWNIMVKLKIDDQELSYTIGEVFTDSDGRQYNISNCEEIECKLTEIYNKIDAM